MKLPELREIIRQNKIKGYLHLNKQGLIDILKEKELLPEELPKPATTKNIDPKFAKLRTIRKTPRTVVMKDIGSREEFTFPSIYKAAQFINKPSRIITFWDGRVWNKKYEISVEKI